MTGHILKISLEKTHPPVWRRIVIPEHLDFYTLHDIIQILFAWDEDHLHEFSLPDDTRIVMHMEQNEYRMLSGWKYEDEALVDDYLQEYPFIRYIYDFGDNWCHKIVFEKDDPSYEEDHPKLIKYKGDNYYEDSGGIYGYGFGNGAYDENRFPLDEKRVQERLNRIRG